MAKLKETPQGNFIDYLTKYSEKMNVDSPIVYERWYVVDYFPSVRQSSGYYGDEWSKAEAIKASDCFNTLKEAEDYVATHSPDTGAELIIYHENKRRFTEERWVSW